MTLFLCVALLAFIHIILPPQRWTGLSFAAFETSAWFYRDDRVGFGHRRLAIIDLSERAAQPMVSADGRLTITFNGEIYNYVALRRELQTKGYVFRSHSDTEVLLHLYATARSSV